MDFHLLKKQKPVVVTGFAIGSPQADALFKRQIESCGSSPPLVIKTFGIVVTKFYQYAGGFFMILIKNLYA
jgi:hypothetical protein